MFYCNVYGMFYILDEPKATFLCPTDNTVVCIVLYCICIVPRMKSMSNPRAFLAAHVNDPKGVGNQRRVGAFRPVTLPKWIDVPHGVTTDQH